MTRVLRGKLLPLSEKLVQTKNETVSNASSGPPAVVALRSNPSGTHLGRSYKVGPRYICAQHPLTGNRNLPLTIHLAPSRYREISKARGLRPDAAREDSPLEMREGSKIYGVAPRGDRISLGHLAQVIDSFLRRWVSSVDSGFSR